MAEQEVLHVPARAGPVPPGWSWRRLDAVCLGIYDCPHSTPAITGAGPLMARTQDVRGGIFRVDQAAHVSEETYRDRIARVEPRVGDLLYSREGTYFGDAAEVPPGVRVCLGQRMVLIRPDPAVMVTRFLRFWLNSPILRAHIDGHRDGSVAERLNLPTIRGLPVLVPPLAIQRAVAEVLGALDDKIELNRQTNETLEAVARALFKSWFVDFDPVRAKAEDRVPSGMDPATAALFPEGFEHSVVGELPRGWAVAPVGELVRAVGGGTPRTSEPAFWDGPHHWARPKDLSGITASVLLETERTITDAGLRAVSSGLLPAGTVLLSSRAPIGYLAISAVPVAVNQGFIAMVCNGAVPNHYVLNWCAANMPAIEARASGTTFPEISKSNFRPIPMVVPSPPVLQAWEAVVAPIYGRVESNLRESQTLANLRDGLLPKLLSGELRVRDANGIVDRAV